MERIDKEFNVTREEKCFGKIKKSAVTDTPVNVKHICEERMTMKIEENEWEQIVTIPYNIIMKKKRISLQYLLQIFLQKLSTFYIQNIRYGTVFILP